MRKILILFTGGTIASEKTEEGLEPALKAEEILAYLPEIGSDINLDTLQICNLDSTNVDYRVWLGVVKALEENYEKYYLKALKMRSLIKDSYDMLFRHYALFIIPYTGDADPYSVGANLAGLPAMTLPFVPYDAMDDDDEIVEAGVHMIAGANYENNLLKAANIYEQEVL